MTYFDFNSAAEPTPHDLIPKGTLVRVRMTLQPGGFDDASQGWSGGYATCSDQTGSVYLNCEFVVTDGPYARRKMWSLIGLYSPKGPEWANMGRTFIKAILNSARNVHPGDQSPAAQNARRISGFAELDGIEFLGRVDWEKDQNGQDKSVIKTAVTPAHKEYPALMAGAGQAAPATGQQNSRPATDRIPIPGRPSWAQ